MQKTTTFIHLQSQFFKYICFGYLDDPKNKCDNSKKAQSKDYKGLGLLSGSSVRLRYIVIKW